MSENKLPSGVGKKIVEALKKQAEIELQPIPDVEPINIVQEQIEETSLDNVITDNISLNDEFADFSIEENASAPTVEFAEDNFEAEIGNINNNSFEETFPQNIVESLNFEDTNNSLFEEKEIFNHAQQPILNTLNSTNSYSVPANVAVLKRLIMQLPQGVTKQTGAQIIRQTMEALGISMNSVLKEAQQGQDSLTSNAKACLSQIA